MKSLENSGVRTAVSRREKVVRGEFCSEHIVQFFDSRESMANSVAAFLAEGCRQGERLLVVAKPKNWIAIANSLRAGGHAFADGVDATSLTVMEADTALSQFMRHGLPDSVLFHRSIGELVRKLTVDSHVGLRIYGEMVEVLAEEGNFHAAQRVEELWNELAVRHPFILMCAYSSAHFASRETREALLDICATHTAVHRTHADPLAEWLLDDERLLPAGTRGTIS
jgi:DcmR-like sensory protein